MPLTKRKGLIGLGILAVAIGTPILAQGQNTQPQIALGARDASRISGGAYKVDNEHTMVRWTVDHLGVTPYFGTFGQITGSLMLDPRKPAAARVEVTIPVSKVLVASPGLTAHMLKPPAAAGGKPDFFGPTPADARFVSTSVVPGKGGKAKIAGNLTFNGVTRPVTLDAEFHGATTMPREMGGNEMVGFVAATTIKRSDFGLDMGIPMVSDAVKLDIVAAFVK